MQDKANEKINLDLSNLLLICLVGALRNQHFQQGRLNKLIPTLCLKFL